jgi:hypothetical protein
MSERTYWQVATGDQGRDYFDYLLEFGMAFVGGQRNVEVMTNKVKCGDVIILKKGTSAIAAVGMVVERHGQCTGNTEDSSERKRWLSDFDGWEQPGYCYVQWHKLDPPMDINGLTRGTIKRINKADVQRTAEQILESVPPYDSRGEPDAVRGIADEDIRRFLISQGLDSRNARNLVDTLQNIRELVEYYIELVYRNKQRVKVKEHETRSFLILPFLRALGWVEQQLKIEFNTGDGFIDTRVHTQERAMNLF